MFLKLILQEMDRMHFVNVRIFYFSSGESGVRYSNGASSPGNSLAEKNQNLMGPSNYGSSFFFPP